jgi:hypothetical protein
MNTKKQGDVGLGVAIGWFVSVGYTVSVPLTDSQPYDLVVDREGRLSRVQVKTTTYKPKSTYKVSLTVKGGNRSATGKIKRFSSSEVELLFIVTPESMYLIPSGRVAACNLTLSKDYDDCMVFTSPLSGGQRAMERKSA